MGFRNSAIADNGKQFISGTSRDFVKSYNCQGIWYNAKYHPQANFVERTNRTVGTAVRMYVDGHDSWNKDLPKIQCAVNTAHHESVEYTPSYINFGRHVPLSGDYYSDIKADENFDFTAADRRDYAANLDQLRHVFQSVRQNLHQAYVRQCLQYNATRTRTSSTPFAM
jgi:hypothetical protein